MAPTEGRRRGPDKGKSKAAKQKRKEAGRRTTTTVHDLPDHVFEQILLRLGCSSPCLVRAAATCTRWCRVVADAGFLARLAATGPPHDVGDYRGGVDGRSLFVPSRPLDVADSRFSLDFLPDSESWEVADSRGSLILLSKKATCCQGAWHLYYCRCCPDLIVCDPLMKRHQGILWPPGRRNRIALFLADGEGRRVTMSNFRIIAVIKETIASVFTTGSDGGWRAVHSEPTDDPETTITADFFAGRANGSLYWGVKEDSTMVLVLDEATAAFSLARLPENVWGLSDKGNARLIGGEDGVLRAVRLVGNELNVFARMHPGCGNKGADEWVLERRLGLPEVTAGLPGHNAGLFEQEVIIITANSKYILLSSSDGTWAFSVELDTMRVEPRTYTKKVYPYELPWPPVLPDLGSKQRRRY